MWICAAKPRRADRYVFGSGTLSKAGSIELPADPTAIAAQGGEAWLALSNGTLMRVTAGGATSSVNLGGAPIGVALASIATTAVAAIVSLRREAGNPVDPLGLVGKVDADLDTFSDSGTGISKNFEFEPVVNLVATAILEDQEPIGDLGYDKDRGEYCLGTAAPQVASYSPRNPAPGATVTVRGSFFDKVPGRISAWVGGYPATNLAVSADRSTLTFDLHPDSYSAPFYLLQPGGLRQVLDPFLKVKGTVGTLAGSGPRGHRDGPGTGALFARALGIAVSGTGHVYVCDIDNQRIRKITPDGIVSTLAGQASRGYQDGLASSARFADPISLALDASGNVYVGEFGNHTIRRIAPDGTVSTVAGVPGVNGHRDGPANQALFNYPYGLAVDAAGTTLFVADHSGHRIRKITDGVVSTIAGDGTASSREGNAGWSRVHAPTQLAVDAQGTVHVAERGGNRISRISSAGVLSWVAGDGSYGYRDGPANTARFAAPTGVALDGAGNLYVMDADNNRVRKIALVSGQVTTVAGDGVNGFRDGPLATARFATIGDPAYIAVDGAGNLYGCDVYNNRVRVITP